ncbi:MAG: hypothetical protein MAG715_00918 [Methanonatronarchaeales archaeon]|nr:hypothetical protein [Methanonatronarchaeales archaeon]
MVRWGFDKDGYGSWYKRSLLLALFLALVSIVFSISNIEKGGPVLSLAVAVLAFSLALLMGRDLALIKNQYEDIDRKLDQLTRWRETGKR